MRAHLKSFEAFRQNPSLLIHLMLIFMNILLNTLPAILSVKKKGCY